MKLPFKIACINIGVAFLIAILVSISDNDIFVNTAIVFAVYGLLAMVVGLIALMTTDKRYAQGFLMGGGILLLLGLVTCGILIGNGS